jgi:hypothetical protein
VRFFFAIVCFVLAAASMGLGIAQRTFLAGPDEVTSSTTAKVDSPVLVIDGAALNAHPHTQSVEFSGSSKTFAAYGRTSDVLAWVGSASYTHVTLDAKTGKLVSKKHVGKSDSVPSPENSDLWLDQFTGANATNLHLNVPKDISVIAVSNGKSPAPSTVKVTWPIDNSTPISGPLIIGGASVLLLGLILLLWAFAHLRRGRGPRRSQPRMPKLPKQPRYKPRKGKALTAPKGRRSINRFVAVTTGLVAASIALAGCSILPGPNKPTPTPTAKIAQTSKLQQTAVTPVQLQKIVDNVSSTVAKADTKLDTKLIESRLAGPALQARIANYAERKADASLPPIAAIPSSEIDVTLPEASNRWPRTVFTVVQERGNTKVAPQALMLVQDSPRTNYKVEYAIALQPKTVLPEVAPATVGAPRISPDSKFLKIEPSQLATAYGDILMKDTASTSYSLFQAEGDGFRTQVGLASKKAEIAALPTTATLTFSNAQGKGEVIALATNNSGSIVAINLDETKLIKPAKAGASVSATGALKALSGKASSTTGLTATYGDQLLFYVPSSNKGDKIVLLGFSQGLVAAKEVS